MTHISEFWRKKENYFTACDTYRQTCSVHTYSQQNKGLHYTCGKTKIHSEKHAPSSIISHNISIVPHIGAVITRKNLTEDKLGSGSGLRVQFGPSQDNSSSCALVCCRCLWVFLGGFCLKRSLWSEGVFSLCEHVHHKVLYAAGNRCGQLEQLHKYVVAYNLTLKETGRGAHVVARLEPGCQIEDARILLQPREK